MEVRSQTRWAAWRRSRPPPMGAGGSGPGASQVAMRMGKGVHLNPAQDKCCLGASWKCGDPKVLLP